MIDSHTLETLEFHKVIALIKGRCLTPYGAEQVTQLAPLRAKPDIDQHLDEMSQMKDIILFGSAFPLARMEDCREALKRSTLEGTFLEPENILTVLELVEISTAIYQYDPEEREKFPDIASYLTRVRSFPELKKNINKAIDHDGSIKDSASNRLRQIRNDFVESKRKIIHSLERILAGKKKQAGWQDDIVTQRNGRYVISVPASQYRSDFGILHDRSGTGATFFVEPSATVDLNNKINLLMQEERIETDRILRALTSEIAQRAEPLLENTRQIGHLDCIHAAAAVAVMMNGKRPTIVDSASIALKEARHPLLVVQFGKEEKVVPISLTLDAARQGILVTGPNTGGKTVALKTVGLIQLMAQSGLLIPVDEKSEIGIFEKVFADIGDEQSLELSLSTFSSHIRNIISAVTQVTDRTLVLFDEIGAGTDPREGAALAEAIVLNIIKSGARLIATTHYSQLKSMALDYPEIENASLEFDRKTLRPTFILQLGIPGSSYAVEIAGRLGMPDEICAQATERMGSSERSLTELISNLEAELLKVKEDRSQLTDRLARAKELETLYRFQKEKLQNEIEEEKKRALEETHELLESTRRETEKLVAQIRDNQAESKSVKELHRTIREKQRQVDKLNRSSKTDAKPSEPDRIAKGDRVVILSLNQEGEIEEIIGNERVRVRVGNINTIVELRNLKKITGPARARSQPVSSSDLVENDGISPEIHLRGMTVDEAMEALDKFLDRAVVSGLSQAYVIHGKGTGTLRRTLTEYLKGHPEVEDVRLGNWNEGGAGVTVIKLRK